MSQLTEVEGRRLALSNLDKVLYPSGFTKAEMLHYYATTAPFLLPHLRDRPLSFYRYPDGSEGEHFFAKNLPLGTPDWVRTAVVPRSGAGETGRHVLVQDLPTLMWAANLVTEFHTPQWKAADPGLADRLVFDLDPGPPATIVECCAVARWLRERLAADGLELLAKTSGSKGLHILAALEPVPSERVTAYAKGLAIEAERALGGLVVHRMARKLRPGKVFVDWSQNTAAKTTATPYTLRARPTPTVSAPVTWDEVEGCGDPAELAFVVGDMAERLAARGDLLAPLLEPGGALPGTP
ncbi:non-homologous end-joining DNA ligase [Streptomyces pathocidini]|uniref:Non-homologous end-joining DNA ligase n=1 Tax=Streptomyces pathocidini TaxID=1650571 RepID=A0ABW7URK8_9ACTN|nr:non-homologous end-joining DNA ligase [Streptomyces pathocidini]